ncbi:MAG: toll/interleukin-1 receptor domain-containing protein [Clostridiales bacterium]|nr:toll/interleukin-1 receptor domain-containing protein [Clostridiales bacterium]
MGSPQDNGRYEYFAFISYCSSDEKWARWLHRGLEHYNIPSRLIKENPSLPKKIRPVFWYKVDLSGTKLKESLRRELDRSKYLIVVCSPESARTPWVNSEVTDFLKTHNGDSVIPFIVKGEPKSVDPSRECFPEVLRRMSMDEEIRGINAMMAGFRKALVDVVATMLGLRFDVLWGRHRRRLFRNRLIAVLIALVAIIGCVKYYDYVKTSRVYYASYELCHGMPVGIDAIDKGTLKSLLNHYTFEYSRGKLRRVVHCNPWGAPLNEGSSWSQFKSAILEMGYEGDRFNSITYRDALGKPLYKLIYNEDYTKVDVKDPLSNDAASVFKSVSSSRETMMSGTEMDFNNVLFQANSQIARYVYEYDDEGFIEYIYFKKYNGSNEPGFDENGIAGIAYERDRNHRVIRKQYLDDDGKVMVDKNGCAGCEYDYDVNGFIVEERFIDIDGNPRMSDLGYAVSKVEYDIAGATATERHYGEDLEPCITISQYHKAICEISGDTVIFSYYNTDNSSGYFFDRFNNEGLYHCVKNIFDGDGRHISTSYYGADGQPCNDALGVHERKAEFDDRGRPVKQTNYDMEGNPCRNNMGVCSATYSYDNNSNITSVKFYDDNFALTSGNIGCSARHFVYDGTRLVRSACLDPNGMPVSPVFNLSAPVVGVKYDDFGNVTDLYRYNGSGTHEGFDENVSVHVKAKYDGGYCVAVSNYNKSESLVDGWQGYAEQLMTYDKRGNRLHTEYRSPNGDLCVVPSLNYAVLESVYDDCGMEIETRSYGADGKPIICRDGWARKVSEYKDFMLVAMSSYGVNDEPILATSIEAHCKTISYDKSRRIVEERFYGVDKLPMANKYGVSIQRYEYDFRGFIVKTAVYDVKDNPTDNSDGFHMALNDYNDRNQITRSEFLDKDQKPVMSKSMKYSSTENQYNDSGMLLGTVFLDPDGNLTTSANGYAKGVVEYDENGRMVYMGYFDPDLNPVQVLAGQVYASASYCTFDENGHMLSTTMLDNDVDEVFVGASYFECGELSGYLNRKYGFLNHVANNGGNEAIGYLWHDSDSTTRRYHEFLDSITGIAKREVLKINARVKSGG